MVAGKMIYPPAWQVIYGSTLAILNWIIWATVTYGALWVIARRMDLEFDPCEGVNAE
jgi:hypothetical protein